MATLKSLGWDIDDYLSRDEPTEPDRPNTEMLMCADGNVSVFEEGQKWVKSDLLVSVKP